MPIPIPGVAPLEFQGNGNITITQTNNTIFWSAGGGGGGASAISVSAGTSTASLASLVFADDALVSFGLNGSTITASHNGLTSQSNQNVTASNGGFAFQTLSFSNANGLSFGTSAGSAIFGSYTVPTVTNSSWTVSDNATSGTVARLHFQDSNGITFGLSGGLGGSHTITASHNGLTSQSNQAASASNGSFTFQTLNFSNANNVTFGTSAGGIVTASVAAGGGGGFTKSRFNPFMEGVAVEGQLGQGTLHFHPVPDPDNFQYDRFIHDVRGTQATATNSSGSFTVSMWVGLYTRNVSSLSLLASSSTTQGLTVSGTVNSTILNGPRILTMGWTTTISQADLWLGFVSRTTSAGANLYTLSNYQVSDVASNFSGVLGSASNATNQNVLGLGFYTTTTSAVPGSVAFSQIQGTNSAVQRAPMYYFLSQTV